MAESVSGFAQRRRMIDPTTPEVWIDPSIKEPLCRDREKGQRNDGDDEDVSVYVYASNVPCRPRQSAKRDHRGGHGRHCYDMQESTMDDQTQIHQAMPNDGMAYHGN
jgi:hypothetical protein